NYARLAGTGRTKKQHRPDWAIRWIHAGQKNLVEAAHAPDGALLTNNARSQAVFEILGTGALLPRVKKDRLINLYFWGFHCFSQFRYHRLIPGSNDSFRADGSSEGSTCKERSVANI